MPAEAAVGRKVPSHPFPSYPSQHSLPQDFQKWMVNKCLEVNHLDWNPQNWSFWDRASNTVRDAIWDSVVRVNSSPRSRVVFPPEFSFLHWEPPAWLCSSLCSALGAAQAFWAPVLCSLSWPNWSSPVFMFSLICPSLSSSSALPVPIPSDTHPTRSAAF